MGVLANPDHERFCQEVHRRVLLREKLGDARTAAYREHIYTGDKGAALDADLAPNARRLAGQKHIRKRLAELGEFAATMAGIDQAWCLVELKLEAEAVKSFNLDDYLGPPDEMGNRHYDLSSVSREKLALLTEYSIESSHEPGATKEEPGREIRKVKIKGPNKTPDRIAVLRLMAEIAGWKAPAKIASTNPDGTQSVPLQVIEIVRFSDAPAKDTAAA